jgi:hypothetical protein
LMYAPRILYSLLSREANAQHTLCMYIFIAAAQQTRVYNSYTKRSTYCI